MIYDLSKNENFYKANKELWKLCQENKKVEIKEYKPKRTNLQNSYYWAIISCIADNTGNDKMTIHKRFALEFLKYDISHDMIHSDAFDFWLKNIKYVASTTELNTKQMSDYIENIKKWIINFFDGALTIPEPTDKNFEQFLKHYSNEL
jgi:hypothetical protein